MKKRIIAFSLALAMCVFVFLTTGATTVNQQTGDLPPELSFPDTAEYNEPAYNNPEYDGESEMLRQKLFREQMTEQIAVMENNAASGDGFTSFANEYTISGTISLPAGAAASAAEPIEVVVYALTPAVDEEYRILDSISAAPGSKPYANVKFTSAASATYSLTVAEGKCIVYAMVTSGNGSVLSYQTYFRADGGSTSVRYAADVLDVTANQTGKNITLHKAERTISGRITIPSAAPAGGVDVRVWFDFYDSAVGNESFYIDTRIPQGSTYVDYKMGVNARNGYRIQMSSSDYIGGYYTGGTVLTDYYDFAKLVDTTSGNAAGINGALKAGKKVSLTVNFNTPAAKAGRILMSCLAEQPYGKDVLGTRSYNYNAGATQVTGSFIVNPELYNQVVLGYIDVTELSSYSWDLYYNYYHETKGQTSIFAAATKISTSAASPSVTITQPAVYTITGTVDLNGYTPDGNAPLYVAAEFVSGESYGKYVIPAAGSTSVPFTLEVPQSELNNTYRLSAARAQSYGVVISGTKGYTGDMTFAAVNTGITVSIVGSVTSELVPISGRFTFPNAVDREDVTVWFYLNTPVTEQYSAQYYIRKGTSCIDYKIYVSPEAAASTGGRVRAYINNPPAGILRESVLDTNGQTSGLNFSALEPVYIKGKVTAQGNTGEAIVVRVYAQGAAWAETTVTIAAGQTEAEYQLSLTPNAGDVYIRYEQESSSSYMRTGYYNANGSVADYSDAEFVAVGTADIESININLIKAKTIHGTISLPSGAYINSGSVEIEISAQSADYSKYYYSDVVLEAGERSVDYAIAIPLDIEGEFYLYYSASDNYQSADTNLMLNNSYYYAQDGGLTKDYSARQTITVSQGGMTINLTAPYSKAIIRGTVTLPQEVLILEEDYIYFYVYAVCEGNETNPYQSTVYIYPDITDPQSFSGNFTISIDSSETATSFKFYYNTYTLGFIRYNFVYLNTDGSTTMVENEATEYNLSGNIQIDFAPEFTVPTIVKPVANISGVQLTMNDSQYNPVIRLKDASYFNLYFKNDTNEKLDVDVIISQYSAKGELLSTEVRLFEDYSFAYGNTYISVYGQLPELAETGAYNTVMLWRSGTMEPIVMTIR